MRTNGCTSDVAAPPDTVDSAFDVLVPHASDPEAHDGHEACPFGGLMAPITRRTTMRSAPRATRDTMAVCTRSAYPHCPRGLKHDQRGDVRKA